MEKEIEKVNNACKILYEKFEKESTLENWVIYSNAFKVRQRLFDETLKNFQKKYTNIW